MQALTSCLINFPYKSMEIFSLHCERGLMKIFFPLTQCFMTWKNNLKPYPVYNSTVSTSYPKASTIFFTFAKILMFPVFNLYYLPSSKCIEHRGWTIITKVFKSILRCGKLINFQTLFCCCIAIWNGWNFFFWCLPVVYKCAFFFLTLSISYYLLYLSVKLIFFLFLSCKVGK